ncbi:MAG: hypothetical protein EBR59_00685 [Methylococcaceae bacterium]|nr:hypothetical protein [Methylococcaceae bacterium]
MQDPRHCYEMMLDLTMSDYRCQQLVIGLVWTLFVPDTPLARPGLAMSPGTVSRTLTWPGELQKQSARELASWIHSWNSHEASVALAAINCLSQHYDFPESIRLEPGPGCNLGVFDYFLPELRGKKVAVIGHYPGIEAYQSAMQLTVLERQPAGIDLPDTASEYLLTDADWVFITASSLANKTFPRLAELAAQATTVLMGPSLPWLPHWHEFGIDYLAGVEVMDPASLFDCVTQGGGVRIFEKSVAYRIAELTPACSMNWLKTAIGDCFARRSQLNRAMERWYENGQSSRFPEYAELEGINRGLSHLDSSFKRLWDAHGQDQ